MTTEPYAPPSAPLGPPVEPPPVAPRRWWVAGLLGFVAPGLGHVYAGKAAKGIVGFFLVWILVLGALAFLTWGPFPRLALAALFVLPVGLFFYLWMDAMFTALRFETTYRMKRYNRWYVYLALALLGHWVAPAIVKAWSAEVSQAFRIPSGSMEPTILIGDHIFVSKTDYRDREPQRGDLVVFFFPEDTSRSMVSRVVAAGGDRIEIRDKRLFINGQVVEEPYAVHNDPEILSATPNQRFSQRDQMPPQSVPDGTYFVLGDNRDNANDSRFWGTVAGHLLQGRPRSVYWSLDQETGGVRWGRIGRILH